MSVEHLFLADLGLSWMQRAPLLLRERTKGEIAPPRLGHLTASEYVDNKYISEELWRSYLTFAVVRDPYSRAESQYRYLAFDRIIPFERYVTGYLPSVLASKRHPWYWFLRPQSDFVIGPSGELIVDSLVKLERIDEELPPVLSRLSLSVAAVPKANRSEQPRMRRVANARFKYAVHEKAVPTLFGKHEAEWTDTLRSAVTSLYKDDFRILGYPIA